MGIFTTLSNIFSGETFSKLDETQEKALVDILTYAMAIDQNVAAIEQQELTKELHVLEWHASTPLEAYVSEALARAQQMTTDAAQARAYCADISQRLGEDWLREEAYYYAGRIATADSRIAPEEHTLLAAIVESFDIDEKTQGRITDQLMREQQF